MYIWESQICLKYLYKDILKNLIFEVKRPYNPVSPSVYWSVGRAVCHNAIMFLKGLEISIAWLYRSTYQPLYLLQFYMFAYLV